MHENPMLLYFVAQIVMALAIANSSCCLMQPFDICPSGWRSFSFWCCFSLSLPLGTTRCSRLICYSPFPSTGFNRFAKDSWFLLLENSTGNQGVSVGCKHYFFHISLFLQLHCKLFAGRNHVLWHSVFCANTVSQG